MEQAYCSSSGGTTLYLQQLAYVMLKTTGPKYVAEL